MATQIALVMNAGQVEQLQPGDVLAKASVGLASVEDTALSSWAGTTNITTLGTITAGTWHGGTVDVGYGGTGIATTTAYSVICAGTTATGAFQSLASLGTAGWVLTSNGAGALPTWQAAAGGGAHNILSATHTDTLADTVVRGDILTGNSTPKLARLAKGAANTILGMGAGGTDPGWEASTGTGSPVRGTSPTISTTLNVSRSGATGSDFVQCLIPALGASTFAGIVLGIAYSASNAGIIRFYSWTNPGLVLFNAGDNVPGGVFCVMKGPNFGFGTSDQFGSGLGMLGIADAITLPTTNPSGGCVIYSVAGVLKTRSAAGVTTTLANHALLDGSVDSDTTAAAPTRGDIITAQGASPTWKALAKGAQYTVLTMGASESAWGAVNLGQAAAITGTLPVANGGTGTTTNPLAIFGCGNLNSANAGNIAAGVTRYVAPFSPFVITTSISAGRLRVTRACVLKNLYVDVGATPNTNSFTFTILVNGSPPESGPVVTISNPNVSGSDTSNSATLAAGDQVELKIVNSAGVTGINQWGWSIEAYAAS